MKPQSALQLLAGLIDPSRELASGYETTILRMKDGRMACGVMREINDDIVLLITPNEIQRHLRSAIQYKSQPEWSLMPDNTAAGLTRQDVADLLHYIQGN